LKQKKAYLIHNVEKSKAKTIIYMMVFAFAKGRAVLTSLSFNALV